MPGGTDASPHYINTYRDRPKIEPSSFVSYENKNDGSIDLILKLTPRGPINEEVSFSPEIVNGYLGTLDKESIIFNEDNGYKTQEVRINYESVEDIPNQLPIFFRNTSVSEESRYIFVADAMGMGHLPLVEDTPGERMDNQADISKLKKIGWFPTVNIFDTV